MQILNDNTASTRLTKLIGAPTKAPLKSCPSFFLQGMQVENLEYSSWANALLIIGLHQKGFLLYLSKNNRSIRIALPFVDVLQISFQRGKEAIRPRPISLLSLIGARRLLSSSFGQTLAAWERTYQIEPNALLIEGLNFKIELSSSGFKYRSQEKFLIQVRSELHKKLQLSL